MAAPAAAVDYQGIAQAFVTHYYTVFDSDRSKLGSLYEPTSMMTWEGQTFLGPQAIVTKFVELPFKQVVHAAKSADAQPSGCGGIIVLCTGELKIDGGDNALKFSQTFHLMPAGSANYLIHNELFRLNYG